MLSHLIGYHNLVVDFFQTFGLCESGVPLCHLITVPGIGNANVRIKFVLWSLQYIPVEFTIHS
jgi:hypothetical protein